MNQLSALQGLIPWDSTKQVLEEAKDGSFCLAAFSLWEKGSALKSNESCLLRTASSELATPYFQ